MPPPKKKMFSLPKHLLEMKFMKKTKEKEEHAKEDEDRQKMFSHEITNGMMNEGPRFIEEPSLVPLLGLLEGRFSFRGMNPEIERLMVSEEQLKREAEEKLEQERKEKSVSDMDMTEILTKSMARKFKNKKHHNHAYDNSPPSSPGIEEKFIPRKKFKFMKPNLDS